MQRPIVFALILALGGCDHYLTDVTPGPQVDNGGYATITPSAPRLSNPAVETNKSVLEYAQDLDRCKTKVSSKMGAEERDDVAAIRRALKQGPLVGEVPVRYEVTDAAIARDNVVKDCLRKRGYLVVR